MLHQMTGVPCQNDLMPFQPKPRDEDVGEAIQAVVEANNLLHERTEQRRAALTARATAIQTALGKGATLAELGELLGVGIERVRQMAKQNK
jgi:DNA-directed RNA polymerase sigma subunit (sigma70/sigma32)